MKMQNAAVKTVYVNVTEHTSKSFVVLCSVTEVKCLFVCLFEVSPLFFPRSRNISLETQNKFNIKNLKTTCVLNYLVMLFLSALCGI